MAFSKTGKSKSLGVIVPDESTKTASTDGESRMTIERDEKGRPVVKVGDKIVGSQG